MDETDPLVRDTGGQEVQRKVLRFPGGICKENVRHPWHFRGMMETYRRKGVQKMDTLLWYVAISWDYVAQMLPCMFLAAIAFFALRPWRKRRLARRGLASGVWRETVLLLFAMFSAGLAALTVFPANFWTLYHWQEAFQGREAFFPLTPLSQSAQYIGWRPYFLWSFQTMGSWTFFIWRWQMRSSSCRWASFPICCGGPGGGRGC